MAETYAIVESGGKQYKVAKGDQLLVDRLPEAEGAKVGLRPVMLRTEKDVVLDGGGLEKVKVEAKVAAHERGEKIRVFKYKPKKGYRRSAGHRSELTRLEVTEVRMLSRKPAAKKAKPEATEAGAEAEGPEKEKATSRRSTAKEPAGEKPAAKEPAARKATARKTSRKSAEKKES